MKIKCYDKYNKQWLEIHLGGDYDSIDVFSSSSHYAHAKINITFEALTGEDPSPERWSDLEQFSIVEEKEGEKI